MSINSYHQGSGSKSYSLDEMLERIPLGVFHYRMLLLCGLSFMCDSVEVNLLSFLATCAGDEWGLSDTQKASISAVVFVGIMMGSFFWGAFANIYGRKLTFLLSGLVISAGGFITAAAPSYIWLLIIRAVVGFGIGGASVSFDLLAEFMPTSHRGRFLIYIEYFWTIGSMFVNGAAWLSLDSLGWRALAIVTAVPVAITTLIGIYYMPESPRWLLTKNRSAEAAKIVAHAATVNDAALPPLFRLQPEAAEVHEKASLWDYRVLLTDARYRTQSLSLWAIWAMFGFTYYGVILFIGRLYENKDDDGGDDSQCSFDYSSLFINSTSELLGCTVGALLLERLGRVRSQAGFYLLSGVTALSMGLKGVHGGGLLFLSIVARAAVMTASNATWVHTPELYPTSLRTFAHSLCTCFSKMGSFLCPFLVTPLPLLTVAIILGACNCVAAA
eukprot:gene31901-38569_t